VLDEILPFLKRVRQHGSSYRASCPVHGEDTHPALKLSEIDGKVLMHCHACGASGLDVVRELGLKPSVLFRESSFVPDPDHKLKSTKEDDLLYVMIYEAQESRGEVIRASEMKRYRLAKRRNEIREKKGL
jgi:NAD-dependent SIR2 family protein deacetylase